MLSAAKQLELSFRVCSAFERTVFAISVRSTRYPSIQHALHRGKPSRAGRTAPYGRKMGFVGCGRYLSAPLLRFGAFDPVSVYSACAASQETVAGGSNGTLGRKMGFVGCVPHLNAPFLLFRARELEQL
ncbi:MAG: hypothetical protein WC837_01890 [Bellilinea sp.]